MLKTILLTLLGSLIPSPMLIAKHVNQAALDRAFLMGTEPDMHRAGERYCKHTLQNPDRDSTKIGRVLGENAAQNARRSYLGHRCAEHALLRLKTSMSDIEYKQLKARQENGEAENALEFQPVFQEQYIRCLSEIEPAVTLPSLRSIKANKQLMRFKVLQNSTDPNDRLIAEAGRLFDQCYYAGRTSKGFKTTYKAQAKADQDFMSSFANFVVRFNFLADQTHKVDQDLLDLAEIQNNYRFCGACDKLEVACACTDRTDLPVIPADKIPKSLKEDPACTRFYNFKSTSNKPVVARVG